jgi:YegS/Rv2252/BmrU family lipid kinase
LKVSLIINPIAGNRAYRSIKRIEALLKEKVSLTTHITKCKGDAFSYAQKRHDVDLMLVAGGDGTFNEVVNGLLSSCNDMPLAFLPLGTTNVLAKELGIPENIEGAIKLALTGTPKSVCLGRIVINHDSSSITRHFCLMAGIGFDGEAVFRVRNNIIKKISGKAAYVLSGIKTWLVYSPPPIRVRTPEGEFEGYTAIIGKSSCYGGYYRVTPKASLTEPLLDLCLFRRRSRMDLLRYVYGVVTGRHLDYKDVVYRKYSEIEVTSPEPVHIQIDGDYLGTLPARFDVVSDAIRLIW